MSSSFFTRFSAAACFLAGCITASPRPNSVTSNAASATPVPVAIAWPKGARAAVSLTYDDAIQSQLDNAVPALKKRGLSATFFLTGASPVLAARTGDFRALSSAGYELASHTMNHPCDKAQSFVQAGFGLQDYDQARMQGELTSSLKLLGELGQQAPFTFAYPCGSTWLGEKHESYVPLVQAAFVAARTVESRVFDAAHDQLVVVPSVLGNQSATELISWVERAASSGGWLVFTFHGVAGDYLAVDGAAHEALLDYLSAHKSTIWTERFGAVARFAKEHGAK